jgi:hypothetical protein
VWQQEVLGRLDLFIKAKRHVYAYRGFRMFSKTATTRIGSLSPLLRGEGLGARGESGAIRDCDNPHPQPFSLKGEGSQMILA